MSLFVGGGMERFGSGRYHYETRHTCPSENLIVGKSPDADVLFASYEFCDEKINGRQPDFIQYWSQSRGVWNSTVTSDADGPAYFPLGIRYEFKHVTQAEIVPSSKRKLLFNFVGSLSTSKSRADMVKVIHGLNTTANMPLLRRGYIQTPSRWSPNPNSKRSKGYLTTDQYRSILLKSILTLAPAGNNPECFRVYEALEAGSIPVVPLDHAYRRHRCKNSLLPWIETGAPMIFVSNWSQLVGILRDLDDHPKRADAMQKQAMAWYEWFMRDIVARFEATLDARIAMRKQKRHISPKKIS
jgi:hypothetical protein